MLNLPDTGRSPFRTRPKWGESRLNIHSDFVAQTQTQSEDVRAAEIDSATALHLVHALICSLREVDPTLSARMAAALDSLGDLHGALETSARTRSVQSVALVAARQYL